MSALFWVFWSLLVAQRLWELGISRRHAERLRARGAVESGAGHYPWIVAGHTLWFAGLAAEVAWLGTRPDAAAPLWALGFVLAQGLRAWARRSLGERWTTRVLVLPGEPLVALGPYRLLRHPNYVAVFVELVCAALLFGAWRTALLGGVLNLALLGRRVRVEERALAAASARDASEGLVGGHPESRARGRQSA